MISAYKTIFIIIVTLLSCFELFAETAKPAVTLGQMSSLQSTVLNKTIPLSIYLPEDYDSTKQSYPVIYMMDSEYRARFAMLASTLDYMADSQIPASILVGVDLTEGNRVLLPTGQDKDTKNTDAYVKFLETELLPHVDKNYRTAPFRTLFGGSNSGFFSVYTLLNNPKLFNNYFASSPSLRHISEAMQQKIKNGALKALSDKRSLHVIYSDDDSESVANFVPDFSALLAKHKPQNLSYKVEELVNQGHVPAVDFTSFLLALYPDYNAPEDLDNLEKVKQHFAMLSKRYGYTMHPPMSLIFRLGAGFIRSKNTATAEQVFQYSLQLYPEDKRSYLGMGVVRRDQGNSKKAELLLEKALAIDPDYSLATRLLKRLKSSKTSGVSEKKHNIAYASDESGQLEIYLSDAEGNSRVQVTKASELGGGYLAWSPEGKQLAFYGKYDDKKTWSIHTINSDGSGWKRLTHAKGKWDHSPAWSPDGSKIVFGRTYRDSEGVVQNQIWKMNADGSELTQIKALNGGGPYFTADGRIVFYSQYQDKNSEISIANADGSNLIHLTNSEAEEWHPEVSPNGKEIAFTSKRDGNLEIYVMNIDGSNQRRLTSNQFRDSMPSWSPDGSQLIFTSRRGDNRDIYIMNKDGSNQKKIITNGGQPAWFKSIN